MSEFELELISKGNTCEDNTSEEIEEEEEIHFSKYKVISSTDWLLRVGDGKNFISSSIHKIWGIQSTTVFGKNFLKNVRFGDRLWFIKGKTKGKVLAVAMYCSHNERTMTNENLGWIGEGLDWTSDIEINYSRLYNLNKCNLLTYIKGPATIRKYNEKCKIDLAREYSYIVRYSKISFEL